MSTATNKTLRVGDDRAPMISHLKGNFYGLEMECDVQNNELYDYDAPILGYGSYRQPENFYDLDYDDTCPFTVIPNPTPDFKKYGILATHDCSLQKSGVEFVTAQPVPFNVMTKGDWMKSTLEGLVQNSGVINGVQPEKYGLHININVQGWALEHVMAYLCALNLCMFSHRTNKLRGRAINVTDIRYSIEGDHDLPSDWLRYFDTLYDNDDGLGAYDEFGNYPMAFSATERSEPEPWQGSKLSLMVPCNRDQPAGLRWNAPVIEVRGFQMDTTEALMKERIETMEILKVASRDNCRTLVDIISGVKHSIPLEEMDMFIKSLLTTKMRKFRNYSKPDVSAKARVLIQDAVQRDHYKASRLQGNSIVLPTI